MFFFSEAFYQWGKRKVIQEFLRVFFILDLKHVITNFFWRNFYQHDMKAGTSTESFQNNKICTASCSKICSCDVHVLDLFPICTHLPKFVPLKTYVFSLRGYQPPPRLNKKTNTPVIELTGQTKGYF